MAARWVGLTRSRKNKARVRAVAKRGIGHTIHEFVHALGAVGMLLMAAAMNFALYPDALAAVVSGERAIVGFVPEEPSLVAAQTRPVAPIVVDENDVRLLAATAFGEARSEGEAGMRAVAHVMVNRVGQRFGENLATVILSPKQFSVWNRGDPNRRLVQNLVRDPVRYNGGAVAEWEVAQRVAREVLAGQSVDPTGGALFYHTRTVRPRWASQGQGRQVIGAHIFYADVPDPAVHSTPRAIDMAQFFRISSPTAEPTQPRRGRRAGRVNGVIQYAPAGAPDALPAPTTTITPTSEAAPAAPTTPASTSTVSAAAP